MYDEVKKVDINLPEWTLLRALPKEMQTKDAASSLQLHMREAREDGKLPDEELKALGFILEATVIRKQGSTAEYIISDMIDRHVCLEACDEKDEDLEITRAALVASWKLRPIVEEDAYFPSELKDPTLNVNILSTMWKGHAVAAMAAEYKKISNDSKVKILQKPQKNMAVAKSV